MSLMQSDSSRLKQGSSAPDFSLKNVDGKMVSLRQFKEKYMLIVFMCNHCPYVIPKMDEIAAIQNDYKTKGVAVICINSNDTTKYPADSFENMRNLAKQKGYKYYLFDENQDIARAYGAVCTPDPFLFDKDHKLVYHGRINDAMDPDSIPTKPEIRYVLGDVLVGKKIENWFVPSQGCSIKWK